MVIRNLITNEQATGNGTLSIGAISPGVYSPIRLESVGSVTSLQLIYYRQGSIMGQTTNITPYNNAIIDLSAMATCAPSIMDATKTIVNGTSLYDYVIVAYTESGTSYRTTMYLLNAPCPNGKFATQGSTGNLTDYVSGYFNQIDNQTSFNSALTGTPFNNMIVWGQTAVNQNLTFKNLSTGTSTAYANGVKFTSALTQDYQILNTGGSTWGYMRYKRKYPYCSDINKRICVKWLNSYGCYDSMYFYQYRIQPTFVTSYLGGNRVTSYNVTLNAPITWDNEKALYWLARSGDVMAVIPMAITQWGRVEITNPTAYIRQGGASSAGREVNFTAKITVLEK